MPFAMRVLSLSLAAATFLLVGCEKNQEPPPRFNDTVGGSAGAAPRAARAADPALLRDLSSYTPTATPKIGESGSGTSGGSGEGATAEVASKIRQIPGTLVSAALRGDFDTVLKQFEPEKVAALAENRDAMDLLTNVHGKVTLLLKLVGDKIGQPVELEKAASAISEMLGKEEAIKVDVLDESNAEIKFNITPEMIQKLAEQLGNGAVPPDSLPKEPPPVNAVPLKKVNGNWVLAISDPITPEMVKQLMAGLKAADAVLDSLTEKLSAAEIKTPEELSQFIQAQVSTIMVEFMAKYGDAQQGAEEGGDGGNGKDNKAENGNENSDKPESGGDSEGSQRGKRPEGGGGG